MIDTAGVTAVPLTDPTWRRKLVTRSVAVTPADALDRLGRAEGSADDYLRSAEWLPLGRDRVRLVSIADGGPRSGMAYALVETEHDNILVGDDDVLPERARAA